MSVALSEEWNRHQTVFSKNWRAKMVGRKKLTTIRVTENRALRERLEAAGRTKTMKDSMLKDTLLIELASAADNRVVSLDETVRGYFDEAAPSIAELREIVWVNPCREKESPIEWLERGAPNDEERRLGSRTESDGAREG